IEVSQTKQPFHRVEGIFNTPALIVKGHHTGWGQTVGVEDVGQILIPFTTKQNLDQAHVMTALVLRTAQENKGVMNVRRLGQNRNLSHAGVAFRASDEAYLLVGQLVKQGKVEQ